MSGIRAVHPWAEKPLESFISESGARLALLMNPTGQVFAQHGFTRAVDVMAAAALGAAIVSSTAEITRMLDEPSFSTLNHQGETHGVFLSAFESPSGPMVLLVIYGRESSVGLVQLFFEEFVSALNEANPAPARTEPVLAVDFERELNQSLAALFQD